jgi:hypothetical protein
MRPLDNAAIAERLLDAVAAAPLLGQLFESKEGSWLLECPSGSGLWLEWEAEAMVLAVSTALGRPEPRQEMASLNLALACNQHWHGRQFLRIARDGTDGDLLLLDQIPLTPLTAEELASALLHVEAVRALWSHTLRGIGHTPNSPLPSDLLGQRA